MEFRIVDPETMDVGRDEAIGSSLPREMLCRGPNITPKYMHNERATVGAFYTDKKGTKWFKTGDIAVIDRDGSITILDRIKEMAKSKGLQVVPSALEGLLQEHPTIADCAVTAVQDNK
jgi:acyl-CoA synthetase (AMP-forming)/AMP-acid ligase II